METVLVQDLARGMRLDESLHLPSGELVLSCGQAVDDLLMQALARCGATELVLCAEAVEAEGLALEAGREAVLLDEYPEGARFPWGLYETGGRKLLGAGKRLAPHLRTALHAAGVDVALEPASDLAPRLARRRRMAVRRAASRRHGRGQGGGAAVSLGMQSAPGDAPAFGRSRLGAEEKDAKKAEKKQENNEKEKKSGEMGALANSMLAHAVLASESEAIMGELAMGLALDTPRAVEAARGTVRAVFSGPFLPVACAVEALSSGLLRDHAAASATVAAAAARASGFREDECLEAALSALLHDAAMVWVEEDLLREEGPLSEAGRRAVRRHPLRAMKALADADGLAPPVALLVLQVHERLDGSGYPMSLRGEEVLPAARLLAVVDVLCALLAPRPHRSEFSGREAIDLCVRLAADGELDGDAVRALIGGVGLYPLGSAVKLSTGERARVVALSESYERPVVSVIRTSSGDRPGEKRVIDLSRRDDVKIECALARDEAPWEGEAGF